MRPVLLGSGAAAGLVLALVAPAALAQPIEEPARAPAPEGSPTGWGLHTGDTAGRGHSLFLAEVGFPDVSFGYFRGLTDRLDVGLRLGVPLGVDYTVPTFSAHDTFNPGFEARIPVRAGLVRTTRFSLMVHVDPGLKIDYTSPTAFMGPEFPIGLDAGFHLNRHLTIALGVEAPFSVRVVPDRTTFATILGGAALEAHLSRRVGLSYVGRAGLVHGFGVGGTANGIGMIQQLGVVVRL